MSPEIIAAINGRTIAFLVRQQAEMNVLFEVPEPAPFSREQMHDLAQTARDTVLADDDRAEFHEALAVAFLLGVAAAQQQDQGDQK